MTSKTHDIFAFASLVTVANYYPPASLNTGTLIVSLIGNIVGSLLPDIDQATNRLWDLLPAGNSLGRFFRKLLLSHRTLSHSFLGIYLAHLLLRWILPKLLNPVYINIDVVYWSVMIGFISHLVLDLFTEEGLPLFFPIKWKIGIPPIRGWRIKTGKAFEKFIVFPGIIVYTVWFLLNHQRSVIGILRLIS